MSRRRELLAILLAIACSWLLAAPAGAQVPDDPSGPIGVESNPPIVEVVDVPEPAPVPEVGITIDGEGDGISRAVLVVVMLAVASIVPLLVLLTTSFTRFVVVLGLTRNAIGIQNLPPTPVLVGLALFLTLFVMSPVISSIKAEAVDPFLAGEIGQAEAIDRASEPLKRFMLDQTREEDLALFLSLSGAEKPDTPEDVEMATLIPAFVVSELTTAFMIGFLIYVPFLIIDLVVSAVLMSLGMVMLPPVFISLPLKLLLFVLVNGWALIIGSVVQSVGVAG